MREGASTPRFSVVMPTFNRSRHLLASIDRVLHQTCDDFELVIVDDGSTDDTSVVLASVSDRRVRFITRSNGGISAARNSGAELATGDYIVPLDDDDRPKERWLERLSEAVAASDASVISCGCEIVDAESDEVLDTRIPQPLGPAFSGFTGLFLAGTFAVKRELYASVGGFAEGLQCSHQTEFALRLLSECRSSGHPVADVEDQPIEILRRPPSGRPESSPPKLLQGSTYLIEEHASTLARDPELLANTHAIAGVNATKLGDRRLGLLHLRKAVSTSPLSPRHWTRLAIAAVPPMARRVWGTA